MILVKLAGPGPAAGDATGLWPGGTAFSWCRWVGVCRTGARAAVSMGAVMGLACQPAVRSSASAWRASLRERGGSAFELGAGSGLGQAGVALASAGVVRRSCAWAHLRERGEDGLRAARLDRFAVVACIVSCVGAILKFFKRTMLRRRSPTSEDSLGVLGLRGCDFWTLEVPGT